MVQPMPPRVVLDTNVLIRGLINSRSPSGRILRACEQRRVIPLLSKAVLAEYRAVLTYREVVERYPELEDRRIRIVLERLTYVGDVIGLVKRFSFPRDPKDAKFIELCIAGSATHLVTTDKDLLDLARGRGEAAKRLRQRLPGLAVMPPDEVVVLFGIE
jgi:uncharacterized protein